MKGEAVIGKGAGRVEEQGLLFEYTVKLVLLAGFFELVLYRLISRLGMHMSKVAEKHESVRILFKGLSSIGFALLNVVAIFVFLALVVLVFQKISMKELSGLSRFSVPCVLLLLLLTIGFLIVPPAMLGSIIYNVVAFAAVAMLLVEYLVDHPATSQRAFAVCYVLGVSGWLYYQTLSTAYGLIGVLIPPPFVHEINRAGEAFMVLASVLGFWAYGRVSINTRNRRQRQRAIWFWSVAGTVFTALIFLDYVLNLYDPALAHTIRKAGEGISWIFQMGMGYTFYLPFAFYVAGLLCWAYTVIKLVTMGRMAGYGLGLMFIAGYALQLSHLTLMVILGLMLLNLDKRKQARVLDDSPSEAPLVSSSQHLLSEQT
ncbi:MAG: hypothetical protein ACT4OO_04575 [Nitrospiraceae bacterium]